PIDDLSMDDVPSDDIYNSGSDGLGWGNGATGDTSMWTEGPLADIGDTAADIGDTVADAFDTF
ncbi:hypothetical protein, partial [Nocardia sp. NPDC052112]|uniref:hypothetical protein n=1 Tax=Nocardia sp. NPDC052112 TaxID=3155646 RepID=UPI00344280E9